MQMPDVNILIYAHRREDPNHELYRAWVERLANGAEPFAVSALVVVAFVRIVTHPRFAPVPTPLHQALAVIDSLVTLKNCQWITPSDG
jgi:predicted nucleic acid-binding protein